ncbi:MULTISPECIES: hypothetical protein [Amycolatopsis]|uniref:hypothetical protein n=1 Tax=Amycolatopsis TaxID=1813 RepID=UPI00130E976E|nr:MULTISPECIES: hypothetical protein [Amycolatopsis]
MALLGCAGCVALFVDDATRRADAFKVLKYTGRLVAGTGGAGGLIALGIKLYELGVL